MGIDFDSNPFNVTIAAGSIEGRRNISVALDDEVEPLETFDLSLSVVTSSSQIMLGRDTSVGQIIDSTGNILAKIFCHLREHCLNSCGKL